MAVGKIDGVDGQIHVPRKVVTLNATAAVTIGNPVQIDQGASSALRAAYGPHWLCKVAAVDDTSLAVGVAMETVAAPAAGTVVPVKVQVGGPIDAGDAHNPTAQGNIDALDLIGANNSTTAGTIKVAVAPGSATDVQFPFAICTESYTSTNADGSLVIIDKGIYG